MSMDEPTGKIVETTIVSVIPAKGQSPLKAVLAYNNEAHAVWAEGLAKQVLPGLVIRGDVGTQPKGKYQNWTLYDFEVLRQPTGGVADMMALYQPTVQPAVPQEVWEANHRGEDMRSAIHATASIAQAFTNGAVIVDFPGVKSDGRSLEIFPLIKAFYTLIQEARKDARTSSITLVVPTVTHGPDQPRPQVPEHTIQSLRQTIWGDDLEAFKAWAEPRGYLGPKKTGVPPAKEADVKEALLQLIAASAEHGAD